MLSSTLFRRATAAGIATMVAATLAGAAPAQAGTGSTSYDCAFPLPVGTQSIPVLTTIPDLPPVAAGALVPAGSLDPTYVFDLSSLSSVLSLIANPTVTGADLGLGDSSSIPIGDLTFGPLGESTTASATSGAFSAPAVPGDYPITMPAGFDFGAVVAGSPVDVPCVTDAPAVLGTLTVLPGGEPVLIPSTTDATIVKKRIVKGKRAKIKVTSIAGVAPLTQAAVGDVIVRKRKRTIGQGTLEAGETVIRTKRFKKPGRYRLTVKYLGDALTEPSSDKVVVRVRRRR